MSVGLNGTQKTEGVFDGKSAPQKGALKNRRAKQKGGFLMSKEHEALDKILKFIDLKIEACGSFKDGPEGAALKSVMEYALKLREAK